MNGNREQYIKMTSTRVSTLVLKLGVPTTIIMLVTNIYNLADTFFVGKLGTSASGAVGIVFAFMSIIQAVGFMFGQGAGSIISRKLGQEDAKSAGKIASVSFFMAFLIGVIITIVGLIFREPLIYLLGSTKTIYPFAHDYITYILLAAPFMICSFVLNNILRFEGEAKLAMMGMMTGAVFNICADPLFIFVFHMDIAGAGLATCIAQIISFVLLLSMFLRGKTASKIKLSLCKLPAGDIFDILATGFPSLIRQGLTSISGMVLNSCAAVYGDPAVAAMSIVGRIGFFVFAVGLGMGQGYQPVVGYNYGAGKYKRVRDAFKFTLIFSTVMIGIFAVISFIFAPQLVAIFRDDPEVILIGEKALRYQMCIEFTLGVMVLTNMTLQVTGQKLQATLTSAIRSGLYFIPLIIIFYHNFGLLGIEIAQPVADFLSAVTCSIMIFMFFKKLPKEDDNRN